MSIVVNKTRLPVTDWQTIKASNVAITNARQRQARAVTVDVNPAQDLRGYATVWPGGSGANKWDEVWEVGSIGEASGQNVANDYQIRSVNYIPVTPGARYYIHNGSDVNIRLFEYGESKNYLRYISMFNQAWTIPDDVYYLRLRTFQAYGTTYKNDIAINYPSTVTTYSPYSNICPIAPRSSMTLTHAGDGQTETITEQLGGNLFDPSEATLGYRLNTSGALYVESGAYSSPFYEVNEGDWIYKNSPTMDAYHRWCVYNASQTFVRRIEAQNSLVIGIGEKYIRFCGWQKEMQDAIFVNDASYGGKFDLTAGEYTADRFMLELTNPGVNISSQDEKTVVFGLFLPSNSQPRASDNNIIVSNRFSTELPVGTPGRFVVREEYIYAVVAKSELSSVDRDGFWAWLAAHPTQFCYQVKNPKVKSITARDIDMFMKNNTFSADTGETSVTYAAARSHGV